MKRSELKQIILEVIEEGKGDVSNKMRQRKAQQKKKDRYTRRELEAMSSKELDAVSDDLEISYPVEVHMTTDQKREAQIKSLAGEEEPND